MSFCKKVPSYFRSYGCFNYFFSLSLSLLSISLFSLSLVEIIWVNHCNMTRIFSEHNESFIGVWDAINFVPYLGCISYIHPHLDANHVSFMKCTTVIEAELLKFTQQHFISNFIIWKSETLLTLVWLQAVLRWVKHILDHFRWWKIFWEIALAAVLG